MKRWKLSSTFLLSIALVLCAAPLVVAQSTEQSSTPVAAAQQTPEQLQQLVAPIALYPDALVAQILAASTYPAEVVEADRWLQQHSTLHGDALAKEVDKQQWDPSVKALTQFPSVLANLDKNISWASGLGDAYTNQQQDVMSAVQVMRQRAEQSGNLKSTPQEKVSTQGQTIVIAPANPQVVYVPQYDPWIVYGPPLLPYPGWYMFPGLYIGAPGIAFGLGFDLGYLGGFGWGWPHWGFDWRDRRVLFDRRPFISHSETFVNRGAFAHARGVDRGGFRTGGHAEVSRGAEFHGGTPATRGFAPHASTGLRSGAFSGFNHGGVARGFSMRGHSSFGGGFHGGGFHGGGGHGGGGRR